MPGHIYNYYYIQLDNNVCKNLMIYCLLALTYFIGPILQMQDFERGSEYVTGPEKTGLIYIQKYTYTLFLFLSVCAIQLICKFY